MRFLTLTFCLSLSIFVSAQTFAWDNNQAPQQKPTEGIATNQSGLANIYPDYYEDSPTALGEMFHHNLMTAGHQKLPLGTLVKVTRLDNGLSTTVRINDRGAYCDGCVIDLSRTAAQEIDLYDNSRAQITLTVLGTSYINPSPESGAMASTAKPRFTARGGDVPNAYEAVSPKQEPTTYNKSTATNCVPNTAQQSTQQVRGIPESNSNGITVIDSPFSPFLVQLGSYTKVSNAERHTLSLLNQGFNNLFLLKELQPDNTNLYRVIIAPFASLNEAKSYISDLQRMHEMKALVFQTRLMETVGN